MRFVPIKTEDQLDLQALHRVRDRLIFRRTSVINQLRAFLLERGIVVRTGRAYLRKRMPALLADAEQQLAPRMYRLLCVVARNGGRWKTRLSSSIVRSKPLP
jgi:transposase